MPRGKVKEYDPDRGCGAIIDFETDQLLTVYANYIDFNGGIALKEGQEVEYEIKDLRHRKWAINVRILSEHE